MEEQVSTTYPTEVIDLPSRGFFYPEGSPLKSGQIEIKYMTAKEEDILTSTNLMQKGLVLDKLMDSLIVTKGVKSSDLLTGDLNAVMVATRILGYGKQYPISVECPNCENDVDEDFDLTTLSNLNEPTPETKSALTVTLPVSKAVVQLRMLTRGNELEVEKEVKALKKVSSDLSNNSTSKLRSMIVSVNGDAAKNTIWNFVENLLVRDAKFLREHYKTIVPDVDFNVRLTCSCSDEAFDTRLPIGSDFFWPDA